MPEPRRLRVRSSLTPRQLLGTSLAFLAILLLATQVLLDIPVAYARSAGSPADAVIGHALPLPPPRPALVVAGGGATPAAPPLRAVGGPEGPAWDDPLAFADLIDDLQAAVDAAQEEFDFAKKKFKKKKKQFKKKKKKYKNDPTKENKKKKKKKKKQKNKWKQKKKDAKAVLQLAQAELDEAIEEAAATAELAVPLIVQEALPAGAVGLARDGEVVTFGLPLANALQVIDVGGRPSIAVLGSDVWQARTLAKWPDGAAKWALVDALVDVPANGADESLLATVGEGVSDGADIASESGGVITLDTGVLEATVPKSGFNVLDTVEVDGVEVVKSGTSAGITGLTTDGVLLAPGPGTSVVVEENGPARAVVRADGELVRLSNGEPEIAFTCRITARAQSRDVEVTLTLRNASLARPAHVQLAGVEVLIGADVGGNANALFAAPDGFDQVSLTSGQLAYLYQAQSTADVVGLANSGYHPHIPKVEGENDELVEQGYELVVDGLSLVSTSSDVHPENGWASLRGDAGGVTVAIRHMPYLYPAALEVSGAGFVSAGLWTQRNGADYAFVWRQHESRTCAFSFYGGSGTEFAGNVARRLDHPLAARAADYDYYDMAGVFAYDLLTVEEQNAAYAAMGLPHTVDIDNDGFAVTRHIAASGGGGFNNHANIERRLAGEWLRHGHGGQLQNALGDALYKAEWQIERSDDFDDADDPGATNAAPFGEEWYSIGFQADIEHRYREGIILAYYLTGDERFKAALDDEVENLSDLWLAPNSRAMSSAMRQIALVAEFSGSPVLLSELEERVAFHALPVLEDPGITPWGWQAEPGVGTRGYFAYDNQTPEKYAFDPVPTYATKGFFEASLMPIAYYHAARVLGPQSELGSTARLRLFDLAHYTDAELMPTAGNPDKRLAYIYDVLGEEVLQWESFYFHPILLAMAEAYAQSGQIKYLNKGVFQIEGFYEASPGNMESLDSRLDVQHFLKTYLDVVSPGT